MKEGQSSDGHVGGSDMSLRFHSPLGENGEGVAPPRLRPALLGLAMTARARAKLYEMNSSVRFRGAWHLCRGEGARGGRWWWGTGVFFLLPLPVF